MAGRQNNSNIFTMILRIPMLIVSIIAKSISYVIPFKTISTVVGVGKIPNLPQTWSGTILAFPVAIITIATTTGFGVVLSQLAVPLLYMAVLLFIIGWLSTILILHYAPQNEEAILIDQMVGLLLVFALCVPAFVSWKLFMLDMVSFLCNAFLVCPMVFLHITSWVLTCILIYVLHVFILRGMPPPTTWISQHLRGSTGLMLDDLVAACYTLAILYFVGFFFLGMDLRIANRFFTYLVATWKYATYQLLLLV